MWVCRSPWGTVGGHIVWSQLHDFKSHLFASGIGAPMIQNLHQLKGLMRAPNSRAIARFP